MAVLELKNITKTYSGEENPAVADLNFTLENEEIVTLLGPSGCGKTTILRMIAGFIRPDRGEIYISGEKVAGRGVMKSPEKRNIGMMFQDYALFPHLTVRQNIIFGLEKKLSREEQQQRVEKLLKMVGLEGYQNQYPHQLSGGQQQRVALSRALSRNPAVVLMDEPFSSLDERMRGVMRREIREILQKSKTPAIVVSHDREDAFSLSDRLAVMRSGRIEQTGTPREIFSRPKNRFVAEFASRSNLVELSGLQDTADGQIRGHCLLGEVCLSPSCCGFNNSQECRSALLAIRPDAFEIDPEGEIKAEIIDYIYYGSFVEAQLKVETSCENITINAHLDRVPGQPGEKIKLSFQEESCWVLTG